MMKRWKGSLLHKMTAVLLSAVLIVGMAAGTVPAKVRAGEATGTMVLKVTVKGYTGSDASILGDVKLETEDRSRTFNPTTVSVENGVITYTVEGVPAPKNYSWLLNGISLLGYLNNLQIGDTIEETATYCTVNFKDGNDILSSQYVKQGNTVTKPGSPQKEGFTFSGWMTEDGGSTEFNFNNTISDVTNIYASWEDVEPEHTHSLTPVQAKPATCTTDGWNAYYQCSAASCGKYFEDEACTKEITNPAAWKTGAGKIEKLGHEYGEPEFTWNGYASASAEFVCERDNTHKETPDCTITSEITKEPTAAAEGEKTYTAAVKFEGTTYTDTKTEIIPKTTPADDNIASGEDWVLDGDGVLTITNDTGMADWKVNGNNSSNKWRVKQAVIQTGVTSIVERAFAGCTNLAAVSISGTVESIGKNAFNSCGLTAVTIPESVKTIGAGAFNNCKMTAVAIPAQVTVISNNMFVNCENLTSVTLPAGITKIEYSAFCGCTALETVTVQGTIPATLGSNVFKNCKFVTDNKQGIAVPEGYAKVYKNAWTAWAAYIKPDAHTHSLTPVPAKAATTTEAGNIAYYTCSGCNKWFEDAEGDREITDRNRVVIPKKTADAGKIETDKERGGNAPDADFGMSKDDLVSAVLTAEEQKLLKAGTDIRIILAIDNIDASVQEADKQAVAKKAGDFTVGQYLDINLYKLVGTDRTKVSQTNKKIKLVLTIPGGLKNADSKHIRSYAMVRVHDGAAQLLSDIDNDTATITFETDLFSTYALVYKDTAVGGGDKDNNGSENNGKDDTDKDDGSDKTNKGSGDDTEKDNEPKTGETTPVEIYATLAMIAGLSYLLELFGNKNGGMTEQEKKELVSSIIAWGRKGGKLRKMAALAVIFVLLFYYHSIGRQVNVDWKEAYGK